jgi:hypothetical protein
MKTIVMSFPCFMKILLVRKTIFVMNLLLQRKAFATNIYRCWLIFIITAIEQKHLASFQIYLFL